MLSRKISILILIGVFVFLVMLFTFLASRALAFSIECEVGGCALGAPLRMNHLPTTPDNWGIEPIPPVEAKTARSKVLEGIVDPDTIQELIVETGAKFDVNTDLLLAIAKAESNYIWNAKNPASSASGIYQYLNGTFNRYCVYEYQLATSTTQKLDPIIQTECAALMIKAGGAVTHWGASLPAWQWAL